jgi:hypothetical protein
MKILTILIFSGDRFHVNGLLKDITRINQKNLDIRLVDWTENKEILKKKKKIYTYYQKKLNNFKIFYQKGSYEFKYSKFITKFKSKIFNNRNFVSCHCFIFDIKKGQEFILPFYIFLIKRE